MTLLTLILYTPFAVSIALVVARELAQHGDEDVPQKERP